jgi:hypothetical protein
VLQYVAPVEFDKPAAGVADRRRGRASDDTLTGPPAGFAAGAARARSLQVGDETACAMGCAFGRSASPVRVGPPACAASASTAACTAR